MRDFRTEQHVVINDDRTISVPKDLRKIAVQFDHNVETVTFDCPRYWDGIDMSKMTVYVNYMRADRNRGMCLCKNVTVDETDDTLMHFTWTLTRNATLYNGKLIFLVCIKNLDESGNEINHWNSELCDQMQVSEGLECEETVIDLHQDIITDLLLRMDKILIANTPILDKTLTERGLAADAKAAGDAINKAKDDLMSEIDNANNDIATTNSRLDIEIKNRMDAISLEMTERKAEIDVERKRINSFVSLKAGSTTGDAELIDARIDVDGTTHSTAGEAVRGQIRNLRSNQDQYEDMKHIVWTYGYVGSDGVDVDVADGEISDRMKTDYILCGEGVDIEYYSETNHARIFGIAFYDKLKNLILGIANEGEPSLRTIKSPKGTAYVRVSTKVSYFDKTILHFGYSTYSVMLDSLQKVSNRLSEDVAILNGAEYVVPLKFQLGSLVDNGEIANSTTRATTTNIRASGTYTIATTSDKFLLVVYDRDEHGNPGVYTEWDTTHTFTRIGFISVYAKKVDSTVITAEDMIELVSSTTLVRHEGASNLSAAEKLSEVFISPDGDDSNTGAFDSPFKTVQHAIDIGYLNICLLPGIYNQSVYANGIAGLSIHAYNGGEYGSVDRPVKRERPVFVNGQYYYNYVIDDSGIASFELDYIPTRFQSVFIDKTLEPLESGSRPSYNAGLWVNHTNKYDDYTLKPVLTTAEMLAEKGTFHFDGTNIRANILGDSDIIGFTVVGDEAAHMLHFEKCNDLTLSGIVVMYALSSNYYIERSSNVRVSHCEAGYTMFSNSVRCDYSDVIFTDCLSYKARNDGFNSHYYGISVFNNCKGIYNYDDGESSHEYCKVIVNGGEFAHNHKGGHSPVNGCEFEAHNTYCHDNSYGFYLIGDPDLYDLSDSKIRITSSISIDNSVVDVVQRGYETVVANTLYNTTDIKSGTFTDLTKQ